MNVCHLINSLGYGGAENYLLEMARVNQSADTDLSMTVCVIEQSAPLSDRFREINVEVQNFNAVFKFDPRSIINMIKFFHQNEFDILHVHLPLAQTLGRAIGQITGIKIIVSTQHNVPESYHPITRTLEKVTRPLDTRTVAVSKGVQRCFSTPSYESSHSWETIYNGIDVNRFNEQTNCSNPSRIKRKWNITDEFVFLNVARYQPKKSQVDLITAMEELKERGEEDVKLLIVGHGGLKNKLQQQIQNKNLETQVKLTGFVPSVVEYYALADAFVLSSIQEGHPITLLEAMAAELPVIGTDIPGVDEIIVDDKTGLLYPPQSPNVLAGQLLRLMYSTRCQKFGQAGFRRVNDMFDISKSLESHINLYTNLLGISSDNSK